MRADFKQIRDRDTTWLDVRAAHLEAKDALRTFPMAWHGYTIIPRGSAQVTVPFIGRTDCDRFCDHRPCVTRQDHACLCYFLSWYVIAPYCGDVATVQRNSLAFWGRSQCGGQEFDPLAVHHSTRKQSERGECPERGRNAESRGGFAGFARARSGRPASSRSERRRDAFNGPVATGHCTHDCWRSTWQ